jgi:hypothetical protein
MTPREIPVIYTLSTNNTSTVDTVIPERTVRSSIVKNGLLIYSVVIFAYALLSKLNTLTTGSEPYCVIA